MEIEQIVFGRPNTVKTQLSLFSNHIQPYLPNCVELNEIFILQMVKIWRDKNLSPGSMKLLLSLLRKYIYFNTGKDIKTTNIAKVISRLKTPAPIKALTKSQAEHLLAAAYKHSTDLYDLILLGMHTGMRKGEIFSIKAEDIDFIKNRITITNTKTGQPRTIKITDPVSSVLKRRLNNKPIFSGRDHNEELKGLCRRSGLPAITMHGLRHTYATLALEARRSPKEVATSLGHASVGTTFSTYWNFVGEDMNLDFLPSAV